MTLRDYIEERYWRGILIALPVAIPSALIALIAPKESLLQFISIAAFLLSILVSTIWVGRLRCPRCGKPLGMVAQNRKWLTRQIFGLNRCRSCGLRVDEEIGAKAL